MPQPSECWDCRPGERGSLLRTLLRGKNPFLGSCKPEEINKRWPPSSNCFQLVMPATLIISFSMRTWNTSGLEISLNAVCVRRARHFISVVAVGLVCDLHRAGGGCSLFVSVLLQSQGHVLQSESSQNGFKIGKCTYLVRFPSCGGQTCSVPILRWQGAGALCLQPLYWIAPWKCLHCCALCDETEKVVRNQRIFVLALSLITYLTLGKTPYLHFFPSVKWR